MAASFLPVGAAHLDHHDLVAVQEPGEPGGAGAGALDSDAVDRAEALEPIEEVAVTGGVGVEGSHAEPLAALIKRGDLVVCG